MKLLAQNISELEQIVQQKTNNLRMVEEGKRLQHRSYEKVGANDGVQCYG